MMKKKTHVYISTLPILLWASSALASSDFIFVSEPFFPNTICGAANYNATYTIKNDEPTPITITYITLTQKDSFPPAIVTLDSGPLTTCVVGQALQGQATCNINLIVNPNAGCLTYEISDDVDRLLHVGINTWQKEVTANPIVFNYQTLPPPVPPSPDNNFVLLGKNVQNLGSISSVFGNAGCTGTASCITTNFDMNQGTLYTNPNDPFVVNANQALLDIYTNFINNMENCRPRSDMDWGDVIQSSYYCLYNPNPSTEYMNVDGTIRLSGPGKFVFFVNSDCYGGAPCYLRISSNTRFIYLDGALPQNVYWVLTDEVSRYAYITSGAALDGTVLVGNGNIVTDPSGSSASTIHGILWSQNNITLYGDTVGIPFSANGS